MAEGTIERELQGFAEAEVAVISSKLDDKKKAISQCLEEGKEVVIVPDIVDILLYSAIPQYVEDRLLLRIKPPGLGVGQQCVKRVFDIIGALIILLVLSPIMILLLLLIPILSPGPAIFKQERLGKNGLIFKVIKFRSMVNNAEETTGPVLATEKDPRITRFGGFLRGARLDELPQFINVLKGDMSIVGPRPEREFFVNQYRESVPYYGYRMSVKPGITGLAQVKGNYRTTPEDKLRCDLMYITNYSFWLDLSILLQTIGVVFQRDRAAGLTIQTNSRLKKLVS
ncbi:exopolysaccharide biosynthesis polyprenyl glycosylphosphotransferase [Desulfosporosinus hippei]|uniref:Exopolysaccharide biosynthesis polyprenyl glycosylphosphotransferase n=1 Tax=Desulfosporosinus hippei DSM 8344 TaxID=1121419 RepID=A0A1G8H127_9FIRM|nr:exopolysaccharide biosynthesis polyprenyl glycosylphosphotransferase [Desulfosporosinus hippei]SDI00279.1 exopolysaccharide biosynthesis polyprenyl glycosylphosphotransferase [Desulfosporosinus hippei DSM 8344]